MGLDGERWVPTSLGGGTSYISLEVDARGAESRGRQQGTQDSWGITPITDIERRPGRVTVST